MLPERSVTGFLDSARNDDSLALITSPLIPRFVFCNECFAELIECPVFNFCARLIHQIQIKMQIVQRDQAKPENFLRLDEMANVAARKFPAGRTRAVFFDRTFCPA